MVIYELKKHITDMLKSASKDNCAFEADLIIMNSTKMTRNQYAISSRAEVDEEAVKKAVMTAKRRINSEPLQYILGKTEFMSLEFNVNPHTLIPRSDTETLVEKAISVIGDSESSILDIGTGSGCVGISTVYYCKNSRAVLLDISSGALDTAKENARLNGVFDRVKFIRADIMTDTPSGNFDVILSNPPYIESDVIPRLCEEVRRYEPRSALDGGEDGLDFYRRIIKIAPGMLNKEGRLMFEIGFNQGADVSKLMENAFCDIEIIKDICGRDRVVTGKLKN